MPQAARSTATMAVLGVLLVVVAIWGWTAATKPFPGKADAPPCVDRTFAAGEKVYASQVTVSVFNASTRNGLAGRTMDLFTKQGFGEGDTGNAPRDAEVASAAIWTEEPKSPAVRLVASRLGRGVDVVRRKGSGVGVTVVVGDDFTKLVRGDRVARARGESVVCGPAVD
jgi:hypothetical protein